MIVNQSLEEELELEKSVRDIQGCNDDDALRTMCVSLIRTNWHQAKLLQQAVGHIAEIDASEAAMGL